MRKKKFNFDAQLDDILAQLETARYLYSEMSEQGALLVLNTTCTDLKTLILRVKSGVKGG
ncbi:hypothetical protein [Lonepinella sp. BR2474]|uniref:hypothetical protein n=1 Tax=Lonepinella sp. BR2474 TaxID=3434548 RepID=UPI003F6DBB42